MLCLCKVQHKTDKNICLKSKIRLLDAFSFSISLYACEFWRINRRITAENTRIRNAMLQDHPKHLLYRPRYKRRSARHDLAGKKSIEDLITFINKRMLKWYERVIKIYNLSSAFLHGTTLGKRRRNKLKEKK